MEKDDSLVGMGVATKGGGTFAQCDLAGTWTADPGCESDCSATIATTTSSTLNADGTFTGWVQDSLGGGADLSGKLDQAKASFGASSTSITPGYTAGIALGIKADATSFSQADLGGTWYISSFLDGLTVQGPTWTAARLTFNAIVRKISKEADQSESPPLRSLAASTCRSPRRPRHASSGLTGSP